MAQTHEYFLEETKEYYTVHEVIRKIISWTLHECPDTFDLLNFYGKLSPAKVTSQSIFRELSWIAYAGGFRYDVVRKYWPRITEAFCGFDVSQVSFLVEDLEAHAQNICHISGFKNLRKAKWCILNAHRIVELECLLRDKGGLRGYFVELSKMNTLEIVRMIPSILEDLKFKGIGKTTIFHLLKNIGIDIFKPDIHVCRILHRLGFLNCERASVFDICQVMCLLSVQYGVKVSELDTLFFVYGKATADNITRVSLNDLSSKHC